MSDCLFCKIAGERSSTKVYEDDQVYAFSMTLTPRRPPTSW